MINNLLNEIYNQNIQLEIIDKNIKLVYQQNTLTSSLKQGIKENKQKLVNRLEENEKARKKGFSVYGQGDFYEYRYGWGSYLFMERHSDGLITAWRANYRKDGDKPYKTSIICKNKVFNAAFKDAAGFIDWLNKRR